MLITFVRVMPANTQRVQPWKAFCDPTSESHKSFIDAQPMVDTSAAHDDSGRKYQEENRDIVRKYEGENRG